MGSLCSIVVILACFKFDDRLCSVRFLVFDCLVYLLLVLDGFFSSKLDSGFGCPIFFCEGTECKGSFSLSQTHWAGRDQYWTQHHKVCKKLQFYSSSIS